MNNILVLIFIIIFLTSCSFDNKTQIWTGNNQIIKKETNNGNLELVFKKKNKTIETKELSSNYILKLGKSKLYRSWSQRYQNKFNDIGNISFLNNGNYKKLSKISKVEINENILLYKDNIFFSDIKGNIGIFSLTNNQKIYEFNFYKKKLKKVKKIIKLIIKDDSIIAADNFGYIYSINYKKRKLNWAKNFLVPFRSNLKIINNVLFLSDEQNKIILIDLKNGKKIDEFYTSPSKTVSEFESNLAVDKNNNLIFLSTNGSLYSLNLINQKTINWIQNFKPENEIIFYGNPVTVSNDHIMLSTKNNISLINIKGTRLWDLNIKSSLKPIVSGNTIFTINKDNYLVLISKKTGKIIYSKNLNLMLRKDFKKSFQRKIKRINHIYLTNKKLLLISNNSYFIEIGIENLNEISSIKKNPFDIKSDIIFFEKEMLFVSDSKRVYKVN